MCDDMWLTDYPFVQAVGGAGWLGPDTTGGTPNRPLEFASVGAEFQVIPLPGGILTGVYYCHGAIGGQMVCETQNRTQQFCTFTFSCVSGDCVSALATQSMRSIMFPIVGAILGLGWLVLSFLKGLPNEMLIMALSITIFFFSLFLLVAPLVFPALLAMAFAALSLAASKSKGSWEAKLSIIAGIFVFLTFAGLNSLSNSGTDFFDATMGGFLQESCFQYYGLALTSARCAQYLLFTGFLGFVIMMLAPLVVLLLVSSLASEEK